MKYIPIEEILGAELAYLISGSETKTSDELDSILETMENLRDMLDEAIYDVTDAILFDKEENG